MEQNSFTSDFLEEGGDEFSYLTSAIDAMNYMENSVPRPWFKAICLNNRPIGAIVRDKNSGNDICRGIPAVTYIDWKPVKEYISGKLPSTDSIVFPHPQESQNPNLNYGPDDPMLLDSRVDDSAAADKLENENESVENHMSLIYANETPLKDRESLLERKSRDFYGVLVALMGADERGIGYGGDELGYDSSAKPKMHLKGGIGEGVPIILVPSAFQTLIAIYNVKEFLEDGIYIPTDVKVKQMKGPKPECVTVQKKFSTDRNRVMTAYDERQFKDWPFKDRVEIFNKIIGFFMRFEDDSVESATIVKQWNVKIISISKNKRHTDRAAALEMRDILEEFMRSHT
ncbi:hypothetical protein D5086_016795 [Populus alba]|uniref:Uncharacterized protein n=1 Tax=Populus alba TaxID=43335 RepID=A0ACC4BV20_POPAL